MRKFLYIFCVGLIFEIFSCAHIPEQIMPEEGSVGLVLMKKKCKLCHGLPHPKRHSVTEWDQLLVLMTKQMKERKISYTFDEIVRIKSYLHRNAR